MRRSKEWWERAGYAFEYGAVSIRALCDELRIDRPYFCKQRDVRGWQIIRKPTVAELRKRYDRAAAKRGYEAIAVRLATKIEAVKDAHDALIRMVREAERE